MKLTKIRWWLFRRLSELGWWVCPEPHKTNLQSIMPTWVDVANERAALQEVQE